MANPELRLCEVVDSDSSCLGSLSGQQGCDAEGGLGKEDDVVAGDGSGRGIWVVPEESFILSTKPSSRLCSSPALCCPLCRICRGEGTVCTGRTGCARGRSRVLVRGVVAVGTVPAPDTIHGLRVLTPRNLFAVELEFSTP